MTFKREMEALGRKLAAADKVFGKYRSDQARAPAGTREGGRFVAEGGGGGGRDSAPAGGAGKPRWKPDGSSNWGDKDYANDFASRHGITRGSSREQIAEALRAENDDSGYDPMFDGPEIDPRMNMLSREYGFKDFKEVTEMEADQPGAIQSLFDRVMGALGMGGGDKPQRGQYDDGPDSGGTWGNNDFRALDQARGSKNVEELTRLLARAQKDPYLVQQYHDYQAGRGKGPDVIGAILGDLQRIQGNRRR